MAHQRIPYDVCPLCGGGSFAALRSDDCTRHPLYRASLPGRIEWVQCQACLHVCTSGYFGQDALSDLFERTQEDQTIGYDYEQQRWTASRLIDKVQAIRAPSGVWLDVGVGNGALILTAAEYGWRPIGIDLRQSNVAALRAMGIEAHCVPVHELHIEPASVISLCDVLEHVPFPLDMLRACRDRLIPGGVLLVSCPNADSFQWRAMGDANPYWREIEHYHNFTRTSLYRILDQCGFDVVRYHVSERYRAGMEAIAVRR